MAPRATRCWIFAVVLQVRVGLLIPPTTRAAAISLATLLVAMFPANIRAARERLTILGRPAMSLAVRGAMQLMFVIALLVVAIRSA